MTLLEQIEQTRNQRLDRTKAQDVTAASVQTDNTVVQPPAPRPAAQSSVQATATPEGQYTLEDVGKRIRESNPQAFAGFTDAQIAERAISRKPELGKLVTAKPKPADEPNILQKIAQPATDVLATGYRALEGAGAFGKAAIQDPVGVAKSFWGGEELTGPAAQTIKQAGENIEKPVNIPFLGTGQIRKAGTVTESGAIVPSSETVKSLGTAAELASFALPSAKIAKGTTILPRAIQRGLEGMAIGTLSEGGRAARETGDLANVPMAALKGGATGAAFGTALGAAGRGVDLAGNQLTKARKAVQPVIDKAVAGVKAKFNSPALAARAVNSVIKPSKRAFSFSRNPGATVAKYKIIGNDIDDLAKNIVATQRTVGSKIDDALTAPNISKLKLNLTDAVEPLDKAIAKAVELGDDTAYRGLNTAKERILNIFVEKDGQLIPKSARKLVDVSPKQATDLKRLVGDMVKWTERSTDEEIVNGALYGVYGNIQHKIEKAVPKIKALNADYSGLLEAAKAATERSSILQRQNMLGLDSGVKGLGGALIGLIASGGGAAPAVLSGLTVAGVNNALKQPAVLSRFAAWLSSSSPAQRKLIFSQYPAIKIGIMNNPVLRNLLNQAAITATNQK